MLLKFNDTIENESCIRSTCMENDRNSLVGIKRASCSVSTSSLTRFLWSNPSCMHSNGRSYTPYTVFFGYWTFFEIFSSRLASVEEIRFWLDSSINSKDEQLFQSEMRKLPEISILAPDKHAMKLE